MTEELVRIQIVQVTMFVQNCMVVSRGETNPVLVVDPGGDPDRILDAIRGRPVDGILVTHGHIDHIGALDEVAEATGAPVWYHADDLWLYDRPMGMRAEGIRLPANATAVVDGDTFDVAGLRMRVLHTPGHSPGSVSFLTEADGFDVVFAGDVLFNGSIGRTDLPGGDFETLVASIESKLWALPDETRVLPGHGPATTIGMEKEHNPFVGRYAAGPGVR